MEKNYFLKQSYFFRKISFVILLLGLFQVVGFAQARKITGTITDLNGDGLIGASVLIKGTSTGAIADMDGKYEVEADNSDALIFSFIGYVSQEVALASGRAVIDIVMKEDVEHLGEVVITGYSSQSKATITTSIATIDADALKNVPSGGNAANALIGKVSGVTIINRDGRAGSAPKIQIRGGTTPGFGGDQPLFIVDGFVQDDINDIDMNDVETFTIFKDAASAAIYGAEAANGVVMITTKKGKKGKVNVSFKYNREFQSVDRYKMDFMSPEEEVYYGRMSFLRAQNDVNKLYASQWWSAVQPYSPQQADYVENGANMLYFYDDVMQYNNGVLPAGYGTTVDPVTGRQLAFGVNDWQDATFTDGHADHYYLNVGGGTEKTTYNASLSFYDVKGVGVYNNYERWYFNGNVESQLGKNFRVGLNTNFAVVQSDLGEGNQWYERSGQQASTVRLFNEDGTPASNVANAGKYNPDYYMDHFVGNNVKYETKVGTYLEWEIIEGLKLKPMLSVKNRTDNIQTMLESNAFNKTRPQSASIRNRLDTQIDVLLTYNKIFNDAHTLGVLAGTSFRDEYDYKVWGNGTGAGTDLLPTIGILPNDKTTLRSSFAKHALQSWFGQVSYDYKKRYLFNATLRYDGSYLFTDTYKWGLFPSISAGWNIHEEDFFKNSGLDWLTGAKITASYGEAGKTKGMSIFSSQGVFEDVTYANQLGLLVGDNVANKDIMPNADMKWETTKEWGVRAEVAFWHKLDFVVQYYSKSSVDRIFDEPLPDFTGFGSIKANVGTFRSNGLEFELNARIIENRNFRWNASFFVDYLVSQQTTKLPKIGLEKNRIDGTQVANPDDPTGEPIWVGGFAEGERWGAIYGYVPDGIIQNFDEADTWNTTYIDERVNSDFRQDKRPGDMKWKDLNGDGKINSIDREFKGWVTPDTRLGLSTSFSYQAENVGKFSIAITLEGMFGATTYDYHNERMASQAQGGDRPNSIVRGSWMEEGDGSVFPRYIYGNRNYYWNYERVTDPFLQSSNYLALRNIEFSYGLPKVVLNKIKVEALDLFVSASNIAYLTNYRGADPTPPEDMYNRYHTVPPAPLTVSFGAQITF